MGCKNTKQYFALGVSIVQVFGSWHQNFRKSFQYGFICESFYS